MNKRGWIGRLLGAEEAVNRVKMVWKNKFWSGKSQGILFLTKGGHPVLGVPKLKHFRVYLKPWQCSSLYQSRDRKINPRLTGLSDETLN